MEMLNLYSHINLLSLFSKSQSTITGRLSSILRIIIYHLKRSMAFLNKSPSVINILGIGMDWKQMTPGTVRGVDVSAGF
jgi:hypothetical protein